MPTRIVRKRYRRDILHRWEGNPVITTQDVSVPCLDIRDAAVVRFEGRVVLLVTVQALDGRTNIHRAESEDGYRFDIEAEPLIDVAQTGEFRVYESVGIEDPRITELEGEYYIVYTANSPLGLRLALAKTKDFRTIERVALVSQPDTKHGALFPERIGGRYARLERPREGGAIWISYSDDLIYWGGMHFVMGPRGGFWDNSRLGPGTPPMRIDEGWLVIYYGVRDTSAGPLIRLGAVILDYEHPWEVRARADVPILSPRERYERLGDVGNLVFTCGGLIEKGTLNLYYGGGDSCICLGTAPVRAVVDRCFNGNPR